MLKGTPSKWCVCVCVREREKVREREREREALKISFEVLAFYFSWVTVWLPEYLDFPDYQKHSKEVLPSFIFNIKYVIQE